MSQARHRSPRAVLALMLGLLAAAAGTAAPAQPELDRLAWLAGCWAAEDGEPGSGEQWMVPAGGVMLGMSRTLSQSRVRSFEFMRIAPDGEGGSLSYFAQPQGRPATAFALRSLSSTEAVFENPAHDFPQRVVYRYEAPVHLRARLEGRVDGRPRQLEFPMLRVACGDGEGAER